MTEAPPANSAVHRLLYRILGGQDPTALQDTVNAGLFPHLFDNARGYDALPALAVRCDEAGVNFDFLGEERTALLRQALMDNTRRNMKIVAQALKLAGQLNRVGITPLFLKGTARLLAPGKRHIGYRKQVDIDLIVQPGEIVTAFNTLLADGYKYFKVPGNTAIAESEQYDAAIALKLSAAHHHLPPLAKANYAATVELHRHFLPSRFQRNNPVGPLFASASAHERHGALYQLPSTEYQLVHLVLGKLVHEGYLSRRAFPVREACDLIDIVEDTERTIDLKFLAHRCGNNFNRFRALVSELMGYKSQSAGTETCNMVNYIRLLQKRHDSKAIRNLLDSYARLEYLTLTLAYSPAKFPAYIERVISAERP